MIVRPAADAEDLVAIWLEVYALDYVPLLPVGVELPFSPRGADYVAEIAGTIAGFCYVDPDRLEGIWIKNPFLTLLNRRRAHPARGGNCEIG